MQTKSLLLAACLVVIVFAAAACQAPTAPGTPTPAPTPVQAVSPGQDEINKAWAASSHATTFVSGDDGANNACARCHAPHNWTPTDPADMPASCASCKFTIKTPKPIAQADWKSIPCEVCHRVEGGALTKKVAFLNTAISQFETGKDPYEEITATRQLCEKCHMNAGSFLYRIDMGSGAHASFDCTRCHNPHAATATCRAAGCHADVLKTPATVAAHAAHSKVACASCHDASGLKMGAASASKIPVTLRAATADKAAVPYVSHNLQRKVDCARCHFTKNPWGIAETVAQ